MSNNFFSINSEGAHEIGVALSGVPIKITSNYGSGGKTSQWVIDNTLATAISGKFKYCFLSIGHNDLYSDLLTADVIFARIKYILTSLVDAGIAPIWSTVWARQYDVQLPEHLRLNDLLRQYARENNIGIFWDGFAASIDPASTQCEIRNGWTYDSSPKIHCNNLGAYYLGKSLAAALSAKVPKINRYVFGAEDKTNSAKKTNLITNTIFSGSGGVAGTGVTGTVPANWRVEW